MQDYDVIVLGAGAAGLMCAIEAGKRGRKTLVLDHSAKPAEKIRISGGGRCNFTNLHTSPANFLGENPRFCVSALKRYTQHDFIGLVDSHRIPWHEKTLGQLFCDTSANDIIAMLLRECERANVKVQLSTKIGDINKPDERFSVATDKGALRCASLVVATGGPSIPKMGATGFGYDVAKRFGLPVVPPRAALVPLTFDDALKQRTSELAGIAVDAIVSYGKIKFREGMLFTHRGLSGPSILQISSYWREGHDIAVNMLPDQQLLSLLKTARTTSPRQDLRTCLSDILPKRLAAFLSEQHKLQGRLADQSDKVFTRAAEAVHNWRVKPIGTEGYRTAEVTLGGVDTTRLSSKTMEAKDVPGLFFIGEVVDITGHLGGFNFQWAWSSGHAAGQHV